MNRLSREKSPYLLQHASNPVDWYPWGDEAFAVARRENKPVFLSIGYSTCHWCHVMERESFEHPETAALLNSAFVCVKVDREERPDIDHVYMTVCQMMTGSGGWPLTILLTPEREAFFAATYIPRTALASFVPRVELAWREQNDEVRRDAGRVSALLREAMAGGPGDVPGVDALEAGYRALAARFDATHGGFGQSPKFPSPHNLMFLLRWWRRSGDGHALEMVERTLLAMYRGGIFDQVGGGFHRYSTDAAWLLPHFEKMLYDQALIMLAATETFQATGGGEYRAIVSDVAEYVLRDLSAPEGGFYSAEDADSEGEEGRFYVWSMDELHAVLGPDAERVAVILGATREGNFAEEATGHRSGANVLHQPRTLDEAARLLGIPPREAADMLASARGRLRAARDARVRPSLDDKVLTDWNGLMIAALAKAGRALERSDLVTRAAEAASFLRKQLADAGDLMHRWRDGQAAIPGMLDDYAFFTWGLLELYEATFDPGYLETALQLAQRLHERFGDEEGGGYFMTAAGSEALLVRPKETYDGAVPGGNSVAIMNMARLARFTGDTVWETRARAALQAIAAQMSGTPLAHGHAMSGADLLAGPTMELVLVGDAGEADLGAMRRAVDRRFLPRLVTVFRPVRDSARITALAPYSRDQEAVGGKATAYLCQGFVCERPIVDAGELARRLDEGAPDGA